ncbi:MAG: methyl-accepting chemotaxis protein [ANME-2 cluster archaeon]|nr:methyl-accepting chemotaxis protein [ANME-2 cluster archaeon]
MDIGKKILGGYLIVLVMLVIITGVAFYSLNITQDTYSEFIDVRERQVDSSNELRFEVRDQVAHYRAILLYSDKQQEYLDDLQEDYRQFDEIMDEMRNRVLTEEEVIILNDIENLRVKHEQAQQKVIALAQQGNHTEALELGIEEARPITYELIEKAEEFGELQRSLQAKERADVTTVVDRLSTVMTVISILAIISGLAFAFLLTRTITRQLRDSIALLSSTSTQILATTTQVASSSEETATAASETTTTVEEVRQTAQVSTNKAKDVSDTAQKTVQVSRSGLMSVEKSIEGMNNIREQMESIAETIVMLSEQTRIIGGIIATVNDVAEQSNLLAVNASIEAAKAGEQGKGFAVVAQEVRNLADQSKEATVQIRVILSDIQKAVNAAVMATEQGSKSVETGVKQTTEAGESIRMLANSIVESSQSAIQIAASSQQQLVGMDQIASAMENIKQATTQNVAGIKQVEQAAKNLNELAQQLSSMIETKKE